jgi:thiamine biosynthesis protein ThiS
VIRVRGKDYRWRQGMTVADLLKEIGDPYPYAVVRINEKAISKPHFETALVPDNSEVYLIPMIAGG